MKADNQTLEIRIGKRQTRHFWLGPTWCISPQQSFPHFIESFSWKRPLRLSNQEISYSFSSSFLKEGDALGKQLNLKLEDGPIKSKTLTHFLHRSNGWFPMLCQFYSEGAMSNTRKHPENFKPERITKIFRLWGQLTGRLGKKSSMKRKALSSIKKNKNYKGINYSYGKNTILP